MLYDFDRPIDRAGTFSLKWDQAQGLLPLWVADMDLPVAQPIVQALRERVDHPIFGYSVYDNKAIKNAITGWFARRFDWLVAPEEIFYCPGVVPAICVLIQMLTEPGEGIVIQPPVYHPFAGKIRENGREVVENPLVCVDGNYQMDFIDLEEKIARKNVRGLLLCSPHNPVGRVWSPDELKKIVEICTRHDKWMISDEIHADVLRAGVRHHPLLQLCQEQRERIILCSAPTKTFNLAGVQLAHIIIPNRNYQDDWKSTVSRLGYLEASPFALAATIAAYTEGEEWLQQACDYIDDNLRFAVSYIEKYLPRAKAYVPEGTYLLWVDFRGYETDGAKLEKLMREKAKIALNEGYIFGCQGEGFERINVACPRSILSSALSQMKDVFLKNEAI